MGISAYSNNDIPRYTSGSLPLNVAAVKENIYNFKNSYSLLMSKENSFINERIEELRQLYQLAYEIEMQFFFDFGITGTDMKQNLKIFQNRLEEVFTNSGIDKLIRQNFYNTFMSDININRVIEHNSSQATKALIEQYSDELVGDISTKIDALGVIDQLNKKLDELELNLNNKDNIIIAKIKTSKNNHISHFAKTNKRGILRYIQTVSLDQEGKDLKWKIDFSKDQNESTLDPGRLDPGVRDKILALLNDKVHIEDLNNIYSFRNYINNIIRNNVNPFIQPYLEEEFKNASNYFLNKNENTVKGYVEEVCMNAAFSYIVAGNPSAKRRLGKTLPTGAIHDIETGQSIPIDMILNNYGFQIKSWSLNGGQHIDQNKMGAGNFIINNLQLNYYDTLINLFGTYQFNQLYNDSYDEIEGQLQELMDVDDGPMVTIFNSYLDHIIRLNRTFSTDLISLSTKSMYSNTFYLINGRLLPGSEIILAMIKAFNNAEYNSNVLSLELEEINNQPSNSLPYLIEHEHRNKSLKKYNMNIFDMSNLVKIKYKVIFDVDKLIQNAYNQIDA